MNHLLSKPTSNNADEFSLTDESKKDLRSFLNNVLSSPDFSASVISQASFSIMYYYKMYIICSKNSVDELQQFIEEINSDSILVYNVVIFIVDREINKELEIQAIIESVPKVYILYSLYVR